MEFDEKAPEPSGPRNKYDWREDRPSYRELIEKDPLIWALDQLGSETLQWIHLILHDREGGGYVGYEADKETLHDAIALILDHRGVGHSPDVYDAGNKPWVNTVRPNPEPDPFAFAPPPVSRRPMTTRELLAAIRSVQPPFQEGVEQ